MRIMNAANAVKEYSLRHIYLNGDNMSIIAHVRLIEEHEHIGKCMFCGTLAYYQIGNIVTCGEHIHTSITKLLGK